MDKINFLPGPVNISKGTLKCMARAPLSHRSEKFRSIFDDTRAALCGLVNAKTAVLFTGSGTLANEAIAAQLSLGIKDKGMVISNGEFGLRLAEQAQRFGLKFKHLAFPWAEEFDYVVIKKELASLRPAWVWFAHLETSTGILNDLEKIKKLCRPYKTKICADIISTVGNIEVDLKGVHMASASSGKGLAALPGIAIVFSNARHKPSSALPKYLDIGFYEGKNFIPFTFSSNLLRALRHGCVEKTILKRTKNNIKICSRIESFLENKNLEIIGKNKKRAPYMLTLEAPAGASSMKLGRAFAAKGIDVHYKNEYLIKRNWLQLALMGHFKTGNLSKFFKAAGQILREK
jgi:aspartate aminotransferase-like enzyme